MCLLHIRYQLSPVSIQFLRRAAFVFKSYAGALSVMHTLFVMCLSNIRHLFLFFFLLLFCYFVLNVLERTTTSMLRSLLPAESQKIYTHYKFVWHQQLSSVCLLHIRYQLSPVSTGLKDKKFNNFSKFNM